MIFQQGDVVFHKTKDFGVGCVKDTNGIDKILIEFGTIGSEGYRREWMHSSNVELAQMDEEIKENEQNISETLKNEIGYSLKMIEQKEKDLQEQKDILLNFDFEKPVTLEKWRQLFLTPLGTFPKSLTEILRNSLSEDIQGLAYVNGKDCSFLWNDIEVTLPVTYGKNTPIIYIDTNWFYKSENPFEKASYLVNTILPKLKEFGCEDIRQWGIMEIYSAEMNNKNMDNIVQDMKEHTMENGGEER